MWAPHTVCCVEFVWDLIYYITKAVLRVYLCRGGKGPLVYKSNVTSENITLACPENIPWFSALLKNIICFAQVKREQGVWADNTAFWLEAKAARTEESHLLCEAGPQPGTAWKGDSKSDKEVTILPHGQQRVTWSGGGGALRKGQGHWARALWHLYKAPVPSIRMPHDTMLLVASKFSEFVSMCWLEGLI